ncbi:signal peptidase I [Nitrosopumilus adriaticus]|uniref:Signal peptidase I n=1 Tax=Nitrosopumilus adriaticus TaxID=1580092 RepID=A0A0D5C2H3_9ARCH|nr:signal peptidase I [Nitrosopumilus adriaticus]AJW70530.1 Signal peptidase I [Nitrosopumilus adriaticus]
MKHNKVKVAFLLCLLPIVIYFWPAQLHGDTTYIMLVGNSMYPVIESGTFVVLKQDQKYIIGDIIGFVNEEEKNVVHRIVKQTDEGFITKGDNNRKNDPGIVPVDEVIGRTIFVIPYVGYTSLFLQTPIGISIFGIWALIMYSKNKDKQSKKNHTESFVIYKIGIISVLINFVLTQAVLGFDIRLAKTMNIPLSNYLEPSIANSASFGLLVMSFIMLYVFSRKIQNNKSDDIKPLKLIFALGGIMLLVLQAMSAMNTIPILIKILNENELIPPLF